MPRYIHQLAKLRPGHWPYRVLCVDAVEIDTSEVDERGIHRPRLASWNCVSLLSVKGDYEYRPVANDGTSADFWRVAEEHSKETQQLVIVSWNTTLVWTLLGLWERLEAGDIWVTPKEWAVSNSTTWAISKLAAASEKPRVSYSAGAIRRLVEDATGYIVLSAPPTIMKAHLGTSTNWVLWIDLGNYGCVKPDNVPAGNHTCDWLADTFCRIRRLSNERQLGGFKPTAGGIAELAWRCRGTQGNLYVTVHPRALTAETASYYGGRAEAFHLGPCRRNIWYLDVRNCYASRCALTAVPIRLRGVVPIDHSFPSCGARGCHSWTAHVTISTDAPLYPYRMGKLTVWPVGRFDTWLCGAELKMANDRGHIVQWHEAYKYDCDYALKDYALSLYDARCQADNRGDAEISAVTKMLLNCLVGRLAQRDAKWVTTRDIDSDVLWGEYERLDDNGVPSRYRSLGGTVQVLRDVGYMPDAMPAIAAWITSAARVYLIQLAESAGFSNVIYMDTDAIMVNRRGYERLRDGGYVREHTLGLLGVRWVSDSVNIRGVKHYIRDGIPTCAGVPVGAYDQYLSGAEWLRQRTPTVDLRSQHIPACESSVQTLRFSAGYQHGVVCSDGRVLPYRLGD